MDRRPSFDPERLVAERDAAVAERDVALAALAERDLRITVLEKQVETLATTLNAAMSRLTDLEARLKTNSGNSSKPPSSDGPGVKRRPQGAKGNKAGGQEGHEGKTFQPFAAEAVAETKPVMPTACGKCGAAFGADASPVGTPVIFQTVELPPIIPFVVEYHRHEVWCAGCGGHTRGALPDDVGPSPFGPRLCAVIATWAIKFHLSRRQIAALCHSLFGLAISTGAIQAIIERAAEACEPAVKDLQAAIQKAEVVNADETGAAHQGGGAKKKRHWLWVAATVFGAIYLVAADRGTDALDKLLGKEFKGIVGCDRWRPYESLFGDSRQICWAHLGREGQSAIDRAEVMLKSKDEAVRVKGEALLAWGKAFLSLYDAIFKSWHRFKDGEMCRKGLTGAMVSHKVAFFKHLQAGALLADKKVARTCRDLMRQWNVLWTFVTAPGVEPTNNEAERAMRQPVLLRKKSQGTRSERGKKTLGTLLSVVETCRRQARSAIDFIEAAIQNHRAGLPPPSLIPS